MQSKRHTQQVDRTPASVRMKLPGYRRLAGGRVDMSAGVGAGGWSKCHLEGLSRPVDLHELHPHSKPPRRGNSPKCLTPLKKPGSHAFCCLSISGMLQGHNKFKNCPFFQGGWIYFSVRWKNAQGLNCLLLRLPRRGERTFLRWRKQNG